MTGYAENGGGQRGNHWRMAAWGAAALMLLLPLIAMQFTDEVDWSVFDFGFAATILIGTGLAFELAVRQSADTAYRAAVGLALAGAFLLVWTNGAVGIIGAIIARFQADGMARALFATAFAQLVVGVIALAGGGFGATNPRWPLDVVGLTGFFVALFVGSALLFRNVARG